MKTNWISTATGGVFDFERLDNLLNLKDISIPLSKACRYGGATVGHYSVATHTRNLYLWLRFASIKPQMGRSERAQAVLEIYRKLSLREQRFVMQQVFAHDMPEAFVCDVVRPVKHQLGPRYAEMEAIAYASIAYTWSFLPKSFNDFHEIVWQVDNFILADEIAQILPNPTNPIKLANPTKSATSPRSVSGPSRPIAGQDPYTRPLDNYGGPLGILIQKQQQTHAEANFRRTAKALGFTPTSKLHHPHPNPPLVVTEPH